MTSMAMPSTTTAVLLLACISAAATAAAAVHSVPGPDGSAYYLGAQGDSCAATCGLQGRTCLDHVNTDNTTNLFQKLGVKCTGDADPWWAPDQPSFVSDSSDENFGKCLGYVGVPLNGSCQANYWSVRRLCRCGEDVSSQPFFGTGYSGGVITPNETTLFAHNISSGSYGVMTHFWTTCGAHNLDDAIIRYYVDGETTASIAFAPGMAAGIGFGDNTAPRGTKWFGIGAGNDHGAAFFLNFKIPFQKSIRVTAQRPSGAVGGFYLIVRGVLNTPINIGGVQLPQTARLKLQVIDRVVQPLEYVKVTDVPTGSGLHFMSTLAVTSGNLNFLEGCYHAYTPYNMSYPGTVISTGTEDYFDSGWYFNAGQFYFPVSGFTHMDNKNNITWSAYRFHEMDPLPFSNGFRLEWRNGDMLDPNSGLKCYTLSGGKVVGSPTASSITSYSWVYVW